MPGPPRGMVGQDRCGFMGPQGFKNPVFEHPLAHGAEPGIFEVPRLDLSNPEDLASRMDLGPPILSEFLPPAEGRGTGGTGLAEGCAGHLYMDPLAGEPCESPAHRHGFVVRIGEDRQDVAATMSAELFGRLNLPGRHPATSSYPPPVPVLKIQDREGECGRGASKVPGCGAFS